MSTSGEKRIVGDSYVEVLNFRHFVKVMSFSKTGFRAKKEISTILHVSVVRRVI